MPENYKGKNYETVLAWVDEEVGYLQFNRPTAMNAVNLKILQKSTEIMNRFSTDEKVKVIILCGHEQVFCAGADLQEVATLLKPTITSKLCVLTRVLKTTPHKLPA